MPQNSSISGKPFWKGIQMDEVAVPILLAWRLRKEGALREFDPWTLISRAAAYLVLNGPVTQQERWEENAGYSPSTLATIIASLVCAADFARGRKEGATADILLDYGDWLSSRLESWMVTGRGELVKGKPRHYLRITPAKTWEARATADPDNAVIEIANGGGSYPARNVVSGDFLQLVRLGVRAADDPLIVDSIAVIDQVLKQDLPQGPCWRRYNHDGYGQKDDGGDYDGTGVGRSWPILTGERGHYELAAGRDPVPYIKAMEKFANAGGMLPEQLWDAEDMPQRHLKFGGPTGSAMPLCWAHAEYASLVRSRHDGVCFDRIEPVYQRYAKSRKASKMEMWTFAHQSQRIRRGKRLRIITASAAMVHWSLDGWVTARDTPTKDCGLGMNWADLPTDKLADGGAAVFTFRWVEADRWEGADFSVAIETTDGALT
jgi:glucoamylase